jgi:hypothetical protein
MAPITTTLVLLVIFSQKKTNNHGKLCGYSGHVYVVPCYLCILLSLLSTHHTHTHTYTHTHTLSLSTTTVCRFCANNTSAHEIKLSWPDLKQHYDEVHRNELLNERNNLANKTGLCEDQLIKLLEPGSAFACRAIDNPTKVIEAWEDLRLKLSVSKDQLVKMCSADSFAARALDNPDDVVKKWEKLRSELDVSNDQLVKMCSADSFACRAIDNPDDVVTKWKDLRWKLGVSNDQLVKMCSANSFACRAIDKPKIIIDAWKELASVPIGARVTLFSTNAAPFLNRLYASNTRMTAVLGQINGFSDGHKFAARLLRDGAHATKMLTQKLTNVSSKPKMRVFVTAFDTGEDATSTWLSAVETAATKIYSTGRATSDKVWDSILDCIGASFTANDARMRIDKGPMKGVTPPQPREFKGRVPTDWFTDSGTMDELLLVRAVLVRHDGKAGIAELTQYLFSLRTGCKFSGETLRKAAAGELKRRAEAAEQAVTNPAV